MSFIDVFREERYYCNHFFRLLCHTEGEAQVGLTRVLKSLQLDTVEAYPADVLTEVAALRDVFFHNQNKDHLLECIYDLFLPLIEPQYNGLITHPIRPRDIRDRIGQVHPSKYGDEVREPLFERSDVLFYREFGALFNAKPDFLVLIPKMALWFEAKVESSFSATQINRMRNIASLCASQLLHHYFDTRQPALILLGSASRHRQAKRIQQTTFLSWGTCAEIALSLYGSNDISVAAFQRAERGLSLQPN
jgi:hypothetical protein